MLTIVTGLAVVSFSTVLAVLVLGLIEERADVALWRRITADRTALAPPALAGPPSEFGARRSREHGRRSVAGGTSGLIPASDAID